jgi:hypothetical protein
MLTSWATAVLHKKYQNSSDFMQQIVQIVNQHHTRSTSCTTRSVGQHDWSWMGPISQTRNPYEAGSSQLCSSETSGDFCWTTWRYIPEVFIATAMVTSDPTDTLLFWSCGRWTVKGPIHDQLCCATLRVVQLVYRVWCWLTWSWMGKLVLRKTILRNMIDRVWAPLGWQYKRCARNSEAVSLICWPALSLLTLLHHKEFPRACFSGSFVACGETSRMLS